jgi:hypothetical protein
MGTYIPTALEKAKDYLSKMEAPELAAVFNHQEIGDLLTEGDKRPLINYIYQLKLKKRKHDDEEKKRSDLGAQTSEKGMNILG